MVVQMGAGDLALRTGVGDSSKPSKPCPVASTTLFTMLDILASDLSSFLPSPGSSESWEQSSEADPAFLLATPNVSVTACGAHRALNLQLAPPLESYALDLWV